MTLSYQQLLSDYQKQANTMPEDQQLAAQKNIVGLEQKIVDFRRVKFSQQVCEKFSVPLLDTQNTIPVSL